MPYAVKQIVAQELEIERVRRAAANGPSKQNKSTGNQEAWRKITREKETREETTNDESALPNHLRELKPKPVQPKQTVSTNNFDIIPKTSDRFQIS